MEVSYGSSELGALEKARSDALLWLRSISDSSHLLDKWPLDYALIAGNKLRKKRDDADDKERKRTDELGLEVAKVYRVLRVASRVAGNLRGGVASGGPQVDQRSAISAEASPREVALATAMAGGLADSLRKLSSRMLVSRLAKKTDWNALFVKLAKVFLQYFLDLILNDMFGTTGKFNISLSRAQYLRSIPF